MAYYKLHMGYLAKKKANRKTQLVLKETPLAVCISRKKNNIYTKKTEIILTVLC